MSTAHRRLIRTHVRGLVAARRACTIELPDGRKIRGHRGTKVDTPAGTVIRYPGGQVATVDAAGNLVYSTTPK